MPLLKLRIADIDEESDSCSDYETAIDMSHWRMWRKVVRLQTPYGLTLVIGQEEEETSYSYIEPNFEVMEETGAVVYESHSSPEEKKESSKCWVAVEIPKSPSIYDQVDFSSMEQGQIEEVFFPIPVDFSDYHSLNMGAGLKAAFVGLASDTHTKTIGKTVSIDVPWSVIEQLRAHEKNLADVRGKIFDTWLHNATELAKAGILYPEKIPLSLLGHSLVD